MTYFRIVASSTFPNIVTKRFIKFKPPSWEQIPELQNLIGGYVKNAVDKIKEVEFVPEQENAPLHTLLKMHTQQKKDGIKSKECTIYVKGFLGAETSHAGKAMTSLLQKVRSRPEPAAPEPRLTTADEELFRSDKGSEAFRHWKASHNILVEKPTHLWAEQCYAWTWPSGSLPQRFRTQDPENVLAFFPVPIATISFAVGNLLRSLYKLKNPLRLLSPQMFAAGIIQDAVLTVAMTYYEYNNAKKNAEICAGGFKSAILELRKEYDYIRVVAHSLGCMHVIEGISLLDDDLKPDEVHLCASAVIEEDAKQKLQKGLAKDKTYHYYSSNDAALNYVLSSATFGGKAMGTGQLKNEYPRTYSQDVSEHFSFFVHNDYASNFHKFARSDKQIKSIGSGQQDENDL
ncbi:hypothetical protein AKO1_005292 [Acrasis kona]|uniref:Uncharacterized protein n=1 Tax=Acrasis kona TaxID=1008807 RepID=A0AAW2YMF7_9EUKA